MQDSHNKQAEILDVTEHCRYSLMCRHVCPVGNLTRLETLTPHGWAQLIALERRGLSSWNKETIEALYKCADCGNCRSHCVSSQPLPEAIVAARAALVDQGNTLAEVEEVAERLGQWENPYKRTRPEPSTGEGAVALFAGDESWHLRRSTLDAALKLLKAVDVEPIVVGKGRSSGLLASSLGLVSLARSLAENTLDELKATRARRCFVLSPGDYFCMGQAYGERLGVQWPNDIELVELIPFLARQYQKGHLEFKTANDQTTCAYVDPTHAVRVPDRHEAPRTLLQAVLEATYSELFWRTDRAYPCGNLALAFTNPDLADKLTESRLDDAVSVGARTIVCEGPGSLAHLERHAATKGLAVCGLYELLADNLAILA